MASHKDDMGRSEAKTKKASHRRATFAIETAITETAISKKIIQEEVEARGLSSNISMIMTGFVASQSTNSPPQLPFTERYPHRISQSKRYNFRRKIGRSHQATNYAHL